MADEVDVVLKFCEEQWTQSRQSENQRATVTNFVLTIGAATLAFIGHKGFVLESLPLAAFLFFLGAYGALTSAKLYERWQFNRNRASFCYRRLDQLKPDARLMQLRSSADKAHTATLKPIRLHWLWIVLHTCISVLGLGCSVAILLRSL